MSAPRLVGIGALMTAIAGCTGEIGGPEAADGGPGTEPTATHFVCDESQVPDALPLRRMSRLQRTNTMRDLVRATAAAEADAILGEIEPSFDALPSDTPAGPDKHYGRFQSFDQAIQQGHADGGYALANEVGAAMTSSPSRLALVVGDCAIATDGENGPACLESFVRAFGPLALRRPVTDEDVAFYSRPAVAAPYLPQDYADVIALLLSAPEAVFFVEHGRDAASRQDGSDGETLDLDDFELASRLSYHFWQTMPDAALLAHAASGQLATEEGFAAEVDRIFADPRTRDGLAGFFREWLANNTLEPLDARVGTPIYDALLAGFVPERETRARMLEEVVDAARYYTWDEPAGFDELFGSGKSFARTEDVAAIYGVPPWDGVSPPVDAPGRVGLITRPELVATGVTSTRPIMKGVFLRKVLLCDEIAPPPGNAAANTPPVSPDATTREVVENLTGSGSCAGCHVSQINPLGFATENFDPLGRLRTEEMLFDANGEPIGTAAIETASMPQVKGGDAAPSANAADLTRIMLESPKLNACFARQYFRYTFGRLEDAEKDGCALENVQQALEADADLGAVLRAIALSPGFRRRSFR